MNEEKNTWYKQTYNTHILHVDHILGQTRLKFNNYIDIQEFVVLPNDPECWVHDDPDGSSVTKLSGQLAVCHHQKKHIHEENHQKYFSPVLHFNPYNIFTHVASNIAQRTMCQILNMNISARKHGLKHFQPPRGMLPVKIILSSK